MASLSEVVRVDGLVRLMGSQLIARMPQGMLSIALLMHVEHVLGRYTDAGLTVAAFSIGAAVSGPLMGRWMIVLGARRLLGATLLLNAAAMTAIAFGPHRLWAFMLLAIVLGFCTPPILPITRSLYPVLVPPRLSAQVYSLDSITQELIWVVGPVLVTAVAPLAGTSIALALVAALGFVGGVLLLTAPAIRLATFPVSGKRLGGVLLKWPVLIAIVSCALQNASYGAVEAAAVAMFDGQQFTVGIIIAVFAIGSIVGGIVMARVAMRPWSMATRQSALAIGTLAAALSPNPWWVGAALFVAGLGTAPSLAVMYNVVSSSLRSGDATEAFGWMSSGLLAGIAMGSAGSGVLVDHVGAQSAMLFGAGLAVLAVLLPAFGTSKLPDLTVRSGPLLDTSAVPVIHIGER
ncbi:MFS transporter [Pseudoclavibacter sp. CFCC 13796]|uniref:MFS transporter n=1 Tax=unclassified Pseudoclavibacter TaxID=2615177 RepID=UPI0013012EF4|nr:MULTISPECIES: MFS transporter [unclassified Pseudoclavibacter]KAB1660881.1 MFS transporter [Pseudoclavibacter sp. CFCC 13796]KAB1663937.1 MFS transporter [Pseudoclavibacter sp. CFCC 13611]